MTDDNVHKVRRAQPTRLERCGDVTVTIEIGPEAVAPESGVDWKAKQLDGFRTDAAVVFAALLDGLPGGTLDALLRIMLEHKASCLCTPAQ